MGMMSSSLPGNKFMFQKLVNIVELSGDFEKLSVPVSQAYNLMGLEYDLGLGMF
jgi:hypothetical protein